MASSDARVLSVALILLVDDYGNGRYVPQVMASQIFPAADDPRESLARLSRSSRETLALALEELIRMRYVVLYRVDGQNYFSIRNWSKHQRVDHPGKPRVPAPTEEAIADFRETLATSSRDSRETLAPDPDLDQDRRRRRLDPDPLEKKLTTTTNDDDLSPRSRAEVFTRELAARELDFTGLDANDLNRVWQKDQAKPSPAFPGLEDLLDSLEHIAHHLKSPAAKSIKNRAAWSIKTLEAGFYAPPRGFKSAAARRLEAEAEAKAAADSARLEAEAEARRAALEPAFAKWFDALVPDTRQQILKQELGQQARYHKPGSVAERAALRQHYLAQHGIRTEEPKSHLKAIAGGR